MKANIFYTGKVAGRELYKHKVKGGHLSLLTILLHGTAYALVKESPFHRWYLDDDHTFTPFIPHVWTNAGSHSSYMVPAKDRDKYKWASVMLFRHKCEAEAWLADPDWTSCLTTCEWPRHIVRVEYHDLRNVGVGSTGWTFLNVGWVKLLEPFTPEQEAVVMDATSQAYYDYELAWCAEHLPDELRHPCSMCDGWGTLRIDCFPNSHFPCPACAVRTGQEAA